MVSLLTEAIRNMIRSGGKRMSAIHGTVMVSPETEGYTQYDTLR